MYKVIYKNYIIDILDKIKYLRFIAKTGRFTRTDRTSANAFLGSDNKTIYLIQGRNCPELEKYKKVTLQEIDALQLEQIKVLLEKYPQGYPDEEAINKLKLSKIEELSTQCNNTIISGVKVLFDDNLYHHFKLTVEDQLNLIMLDKKIKAGAKQVIYHETNSTCKLFSDQNISKLIKAADAHKQYHTTYFNILKYFINNCSDPDKIDQLKYGVQLDNLDLPTEILQLMEN